MKLKHIAERLYDIQSGDDFLNTEDGLYINREDLMHILHLIQERLAKEECVNK